MKRAGLKFLQEWLISDQRKPLVMRGARQVGKTWLVRDFARSQNKHLIEINFERRPQFSSLFMSNDPQHILLSISAAFNISIDPKDCILFLGQSPLPKGRGL